jgi:hypothetical protein
MLIHSPICTRASDADSAGKVKFIKFFAWEQRWIDRALTAREEELRWMLKGASLDIFGFFNLELEPTCSEH